MNDPRFTEILMIFYWKYWAGSKSAFENIPERKIWIIFEQ